MNERTVIKSVVALLVIAGALATGSTDIIYVAATFLFFVICVAYAEWCERL
jgi:hypothetical protein